MEEAFLYRVMNVLDERIILGLQRLRDTFFITVVGGKALNALVRTGYRDLTLDWDVNVTTDENTVASNAYARDTLGRTLVQMLEHLREHHRFRLEAIEEATGVHIKGFVYDVNPTAFLAYTGASYNIGHVNILTDTLGRISIIDIVPHQLHSRNAFVTIDGINFLGVEGLKENFRNLLQTPSYYKKEKVRRRLRKLLGAIRATKLTCNLYKQEAKTYPGALRQCVSDTVLGPVEPLLGPGGRPYRRYNFSQRDMDTHKAYIASLTPEQQKIIYDYTDTQSAVWNSQLNHNALVKEEAPVPLSPAISVLREIINRAPPLTQDTTVYMTGRYLVYPESRRSNFDFEPGEKELRYGFSSTTLDNWYNPRPFIDLFSAGVAYVITIPKGSRVLMITDYSKYPHEQEVLLPPNSTLLIKQRLTKEITYKDLSQMWYDEMITYVCTYIPKESKSGIPVIDIPQFKSVQHFEDYLQIPQMKQIFTKLWAGNQFL